MFVRARKQGDDVLARTVRALCDGAIVAVSFLALLELFRESVVSFDQVTPLGELTIRWTGTEDGEVEVSAEFDESDAVPAGAPDDGHDGARAANEPETEDADGRQ